MFKWFFIILSSFWMSNTNGQTLDHSLTKEVDYKTNMDSLFSKIEFLSDSIKETLNEEDSISLVRNAYDTLNYDTLKYYSVDNNKYVFYNTYYDNRSFLYLFDSGNIETLDQILPKIRNEYETDEYVKYEKLIVDTYTEGYMVTIVFKYGHFSCFTIRNSFI